MKKLLILIALMMSVSSASAFVVTIHQADGDRYFESGNIEKITFGTDGIVVVMMKEGEPVVLSADEFKSLDFTNSGWNGVESALSTDDLRFDGDNLVSKIGRVSIYSTDGKLMAQGSESVTVRGLAKGIYVVKAGNKTCKIILR